MEDNLFSYGCKTLPINTIIFMLLCLDYVVNKTIIYNHVKVGFPAIRGIHSWGFLIIQTCLTVEKNQVSQHDRVTGLPNMIQLK